MRSLVIGCLCLFLTGAASGQDCFDCLLGIYDDPALSVNRGTIVPGEPKDIYVGVKLRESDTELAGIEFSIAGLDDGDVYLLGAVPLGPRALVFGTVPAPRDTTEDSEEVGGATVAWTTCPSSRQALLKLTIYAYRPVSDKILVVKRSYPTTNPAWASPIIVRCAPPAYPIARVSGGCYLLNWSGNIARDCMSAMAVSVNQETWSAVKQIYR